MERKTFNEYLKILEYDNMPDIVNDYMKKINAFFEMFTSVDSVPKREKYYGFIKSFFKSLIYLSSCFKKFL